MTHRLPRFVTNIFPVLTYEDQNERNKAALMLQNDPLIARAGIVINPIKQEKISADRIQDAMNKLEGLSDKAYYNYLTTLLKDNNDAIRITAYNYLKDDSFVSRELLDSATKGGKMVISDVVRGNLYESIASAIDGYYRRENERIQSGFYSDVQKPRTYNIPEGEGQLVLASTAGPLVVYNAEGVFSAFDQISKDIIAAPQSFSDQLIDQRAAEIYTAFSKYTQVSKTINPSTIRSLFVSFRQLAPLINKSSGPGADEMKRAIGQVMIDVRNGNDRAALQNVSGILMQTTTLQAMTEEWGKKGYEKSDYWRQMGWLMEQAAVKTVNELRGEKASLLSANEQLKLELQRINAEKERNGLSLGEKTREIGELNAKISSLVETLKGKEQEIAQKTKEYERMRASYNEAAKGMKAQFEAQYNASMEEYKQKLEKQVAELEKTKEEYSTLEITYNSTVREKNDLVSQVNDIKKELKEYAQVEATVSGCIRVVIKKLTALKSQNDEILVQKAELLKINTQLEAKIKLEVEKTASQTRAIEEKEQELTAHLTQIKELKETIAKTQGDLKIESELRLKYEEDIRVLRTEISKLETSLKTQKDITTDTKNIYLEQISGLKVQLKNAIESRDEKSRLIESYKKNNGDLQKIVDDYNMKMNALEGEKEELLRKNNALNETQSKIVQTCDEMKKINEGLEQEINAKNLEISSLSGQILELNATNERLSIAEAKAKREGKLVKESEEKLKEIIKLKDIKLEEKDQNLKRALGERNRALAENALFQDELNKLRAAQENDHNNDVIMTEVDPPAMPHELVNEICEMNIRNAGKKPEVIVMVDPVQKRSIEPPRLGGAKKRKVVLSTSVPKKAKTAIKTKAKKASRVVANSSTRSTSSTGAGGRARNTTKGGFVVGGRPDPLIHRGGTAFWQNLYKSHYHLF